MVKLSTPPFLDSKSPVGQTKCINFIISNSHHKNSQVLSSIKVTSPSHLHHKQLNMSISMNFNDIAQCTTLPKRNEECRKRTNLTINIYLACSQMNSVSLQTQTTKQLEFIIWNKSPLQHFIVAPKCLLQVVLAHMSIYQ